VPFIIILHKTQRKNQKIKMKWVGKGETIFFLRLYLLLFHKPKKEKERKGEEEESISFFHKQIKRKSKIKKGEKKEEIFFFYFYNGNVVLGSKDIEQCRNWSNVDSKLELQQ
jgi:hypothetical protein